MWFIRLVKLKNPPSKDMNEWLAKVRAEGEKWGVKFHQTYFTLGRYDVVSILEAPDEKTAMRLSMKLQEGVTSAETLVAVSREEVDNWSK
jgi:uncharacterized protein with GYD domain